MKRNHIPVLLFTIAFMLFCNNAFLSVVRAVTLYDTQTRSQLQTDQQFRAM